MRDENAPPSPTKLLRDDLVAELHAIVKEVKGQRENEKKDHGGAVYRANALQHVAEAFAALDRATSARILANHKINDHHYRSNEP